MEFLSKVGVGTTPTTSLDIVNNETYQLSWNRIGGDTGYLNSSSNGVTIRDQNGNLMALNPTCNSIAFYAGGFNRMEICTGCTSIYDVVVAPQIKLTTGAAAGCVLTSSADGTASWATPSSGGISFNGSTADGLVTYGDASTANVETNLTFNGTCLNLALGANRVIQMPDAGSGVGNATCLFIRGHSRSVLGTSGQGTAGNIYLQGGGVSPALSSPTSGGAVGITGGVACSTASATGGGVTIAGGCGIMSVNTGSGTGGNVIICGGVGFGNGGSSNIGCVALYHGTTLRLNTNTTGVCVTGILDVSTSVDTPYVSNGTVGLCIIGSSNTILYYNGTTGGAKLCTVTNGVCLGANCGFGVDWVSTSDCRLKTDIRPISNALSMVTQLQGVCYHGCDDEKCESRIGLIAQEVVKILPEVVSHSIPSEDEMKFGITDEKLGIKYDKLTAVLVEAVKEQQLKINELENKINKIINK